MKSTSPSCQNKQNNIQYTNTQMIFKIKYLLVFKHNSEWILMNIFDKSLKRKQFCCKTWNHNKAAVSAQTETTREHHCCYNLNVGKFPDNPTAWVRRSKKYVTHGLLKAIFHTDTFTTEVLFSKFIVFFTGIHSYFTQAKGESCSPRARSPTQNNVQQLWAAPLASSGVLLKQKRKKSPKQLSFRIAQSEGWIKFGYVAT